MKYPEYKSTQNRLRKCRIASGLKPDFVAKTLGLKQTGKISRWETGACLPTLVNALKLAGLYKVYVEDLFFDLMHTTREEVTKEAEELINQTSMQNINVNPQGSQRLNSPRQSNLTT